MQIFLVIIGENCLNNVFNIVIMVLVGYFKVIYINSSEVSFFFKFLQDEKIEWLGGFLFEDSLECGFDNDKCNFLDFFVGESGMIIYYMIGFVILIFFIWERCVEYGNMN